jgi:hypothetical protein
MPIFMNSFILQKNVVTFNNIISCVLSFKTILPFSINFGIKIQVIPGIIGMQIKALIKA